MHRQTRAFISTCRLRVCQLSFQGTMTRTGCGVLTLIFLHVTVQQLGVCSEPLHLTPLLDERNISAALTLSEVKDPKHIIPKSYSGFMTTDRKLGNHLFFWFIPAMSPTASKPPLVIWLNGGPGVSSMLGLTFENGPIRVKSLDDGDVTYEKWEKSWAERFSMLYIDNPVGVGYSYSDSGSSGYKSTQDGYSSDLFAFLEQFYVMFPEYLKRELYIGGQSYAGKYVPSFAYRIHREIVTNKSAIPLKGIYLSAPYFDPELQSVMFGDYFYAMGAISHPQLLKAKSDVAEVFAAFRKGQHDMDYSATFNKLFPEFGIGFVDNYVTMEEPPYGKVQILMRSDSVRSILHAGNLTFKIFNRDVRSKFMPDLLITTKPKMVELLNNYKVLIFTGDYDALVNSVMVDNALMSTPWRHQARYNASRRYVWGSARSKPHGYYSKVERLCRVVIHGAGHQIPYDQPDSSRDMMIQFIEHGCISDQMNYIVPSLVISSLSVAVSLVAALF